VAIVPGVLTARIATSLMFAPEASFANCSIIGTTAAVAWPLGMLVPKTYLKPAPGELIGAACTSHGMPARSVISVIASCAS
jgi:hypothetical protein